MVPAPGKCVEAQEQLIVLDVLNIATDLMLLLLPLPTLFSLQTLLKRKLRLMLICTLGIFIIAITLIRLPINALNASVQANRTVWASTELLTAAIVANAPNLYGAVNKARRGSQAIFDATKQETRGASTAESERYAHRLVGLRNRLDDEDLMLKTEDRDESPAGLDYPGKVHLPGNHGFASNDFAHRQTGQP